MQYLLTAQEYSDLISKEKSLDYGKELIDNREKIINAHLLAIEEPCIHNTNGKNHDGYCDDCPFGPSWNDSYLFDCGREQDFSD